MDTLQIDRADGVVTVTLNRPHKKNAVDGVMWSELWVTFKEISQNEADRVLVLTGAGGDFCAGADLSAPRSDQHQLTIMRHVNDTALTLHQMPKPVIAKVRGVAVGAGMNLALGADLVVASENARFSEIFARRGLSLDFGGSWLLPRLIGLHRAKELALFGDILGASDAAELGLVNRVLPDDELDAFVDEWARRLVNSPTIAIASSKRMLNNAFSITLDQALEDEARSQTINRGTADTREAVKAFLEKRDPTFTGR